VALRADRRARRRLLGRYPALDRVGIPLRHERERGRLRRVAVVVVVRGRGWFGGRERVEQLAELVERRRRA